MQTLKPSNTREQCAWDSGAYKARVIYQPELPMTSAQWGEKRDQRNPHKKGSKERDFWNAGFASVTQNGK